MIDIWGHRGCRGPDNPPENSLAAFASAIEQGAQGFELDLFLTRDRQLVAFHDERLERMTNGVGRLANSTLAELKQLRLKTAAGLSEDAIPTYMETLDLVARSGKLNDSVPFIINTEIKGRGIASYVAEAIDTRLQQGWRIEHFLISSFDAESLREMRSLMPSVPIGALFQGGFRLPGQGCDISQTALARRLRTVRDIRPGTIHITYASLTPDALRMLKECGARPVAWTYCEINPAQLCARARRAMADQLVANGITLITDYPREMLMLLKENA